MLIKQLDDRSHEVESLDRLIGREDIPRKLKDEMAKQLRLFKAGMRGEKDAAYEIDFHYGDTTQNWAVIHDLRIEHEGRIAQIDHILINRFLEFWVCESKSYSEGMSINEHGECAMYWQGRAKGIASPYEQNAKHIHVLESLCGTDILDIPKRLGLRIQPKFRGMILVSKTAKISRPASKGWWNEGIIKADQLRTHIEKKIDEEISPLMAARIISSEALESLARKLAQLHRPVRNDWLAKFGLDGLHETAIKQNVATYVEVAPSVSVEKNKLGQVCGHCGVAVGNDVAYFCRLRKQRFAGNLYCRECQKHYPAATK